MKIILKFHRWAQNLLNESHQLFWKYDHHESITNFCQTLIQSL